MVDETQQYSAAEMERITRVQDALLEGDGKEDHPVGGGTNPWGDGLDDAQIGERLRENGYTGLAELAMGRPARDGFRWATVENVLICKKGLLAPEHPAVP